MLAYQAGDISAFEELFARYKTRMFNYFRRLLKDPAHVEDLFQTLFLRVHRARETYRPQAAFSTWIYTIARNLARDAVAKNATEERHEARGRSGTAAEAMSLPESMRGEEGTPEAALRHKETARRLSEAFFSLSPEAREILVLSKYEGLSFPHIAELLGCSVSAAKVRAFRALRALRLALEKKGDAC
jgi:RNA polymerase sigma-70 factor (ECF subfamily)